MEQPLKVVVSHRFDSSPERVFDAWLSTDLIEKWAFGPDMRDEEILHLKIDARVGGQFSFLVLRDGQELDHRGTYHEIDRPRRLVFSWGVNEEAGDTSMVAIDIVPLDSGCELTLTHSMDPQWAEYAERTKNGWTTMVKALAASLD